VNDFNVRHQPRNNNNNNNGSGGSSPMVERILTYIVRIDTCKIYITAKEQ